MPIIATAGSSGPPIPPLEPGVYMGTCISVVDLGTHRNEKFEKDERRVRITWEIEGETVEVDGEEKPRVMSNGYTLSLHEKSKLRRDLESWRGKKFTPAELAGFDIALVLGKGCQLQVAAITTNQGKNISVIQAIMALPKGAAIPMPQSEMYSWSIDEETIPENLPKWSADEIQASQEWQTRLAPY